MNWLAIAGFGGMVIGFLGLVLPILADPPIFFRVGSFIMFLTGLVIYAIEKLDVEEGTVRV